MNINKLKNLLKIFVLSGISLAVGFMGGAWMSIAALIFIVVAMGMIIPRMTEIPLLVLLLYSVSVVIGCGFGVIAAQYQVGQSSLAWLLLLSVILIVQMSNAERKFKTDS